MGTSPGPCSLEDLQQLSNGYSLILNCDICTSDFTVIWNLIYDMKTHDAYEERNIIPLTKAELIH